MIELYFNDASLLPENREEKQYAEEALNNILAGKTSGTEMCILPCFYDAPQLKMTVYQAAGSAQRAQTNEQAVEWAGRPEAVSC